MRSWSSSSCNYTLNRDGARGKDSHRKTSPCVCSSSLLSAPVPRLYDPSPTPLLSACFSYQTFFTTLSYFLHPSLRPCLNPIPSHSHLSNSYPPLSISSSAPHPSYSTSVGMTDCWNWADSPPHCLQSAPYNHNYVAPDTQPLCALITPHCKEIISGRDQILKHDGSVLVFKWSWSCWFLIRGAEDA